MNITANTLFYGDNLDILREYIPDEFIDLIYLDPPFNSSRSYNVLFKDESGRSSEAQLTAFDDTWHWGPSAENTFHELMASAPLDIAKMVDALRAFIGENQMMAYLVMMTARLVELHRVLKSTGSLYLHCDPTASHYLKILLDVVFSPANFKSEIVWKRTTAHSSAKRYGPVHDIILFYTKTDNYTWNQQYEAYSQEYVNQFYKFIDERGDYQSDNLTAAGIRKGDSGEPWKGVNPTSKGRHWAVPTLIVEEIVGHEKASTLTTQEKLDLLDKEGYILWPKKGNMCQSSPVNVPVIRGNDVPPFEWMQIGKVQVFGRMLKDSVSSFAPPPTGSCAPSSGS